jgi:geranylgeranyl diphosphate synthase type II
MDETCADAFLSYARDARLEVDAALEAYTRLSADCPARLAEAIRYMLLASGKRLRPLLVLMSCEACGCHRNAALPAACAVEMVHTYSLIHDDLPAMDDDDWRRGRASCHVQFDQATAILAGDALLALAFEVLATGMQPPAVAARGCAELARAAGPTQLVGGQMDDLCRASVDRPLSWLEAVHRRKTGAMFLVSVRLGGMSAGGTPEQLYALQQYAERLGLAFQITDDLLDVRGEESAVGKRVGKDSRRGKRTFPAMLGVDASAARARQLVEEGCAQLAGFGPRAAPLAALARYVTVRDR